MRLEPKLLFKQQPQVHRVLGFVSTVVYRAAEVL